MIFCKNFNNISNLYIIDQNKGFTQSFNITHLSIASFRNLLLTLPMKYFFLIVTLVVIHTTFSIETSILKHLTHDDQTTLIIANEFMNIMQSQRNFNHQQFTCLTLLPMKFIAQKKQVIHNLNITYSYDNKNTQLSTPSSSQQTKTLVGYRYDHDYDKILDLLHGTCVIHETTSFLYEYCHKYSVRQFDDVFTKQRMAKEQYQDISMGYYDYQSALKKSQSPHNKGLKPGNAMYEIKYSQNGDLNVLSKLLENVPELTLQEKKLLEKTIAETLQLQIQGGDTTNQQTQSIHSSKQIKGKKSVQKMKQSKLKRIKLQSLPTRSVIYDESNLFTVETINHKEYHFDKQTKIIHLNYPIVMTNKYFVKAEIVYDVTCENQINDTIRGVYVAKGVVVSPFQVLFVGDVENCHIVRQISARPIQQKLYEEHYSFDRMRVVGDIAFGYVEEICTNNWDWQSKRGKDTEVNSISPKKNNFLEPGTTLWLEVAINSTINENQITFHHYPVTVKEVIANGVVRMEEQILSKIAEKRTPNDTVWINSCKLISKKPLNKNLYTTQKKIIKRNLIKIKQLSLQNPQTSSIDKKQPGDEMLCLCRFNKYGENFLQMHIELGEKLFDSNQQNNYYSYFEFFQTERTVKTEKENDPELYTLCTSGLMCFDVEKQNNIQQQQRVKNSEGFTQITNINSNTKPLTQNLDIDEQIIILEISQFGMIKVHTQTSQGEKFQYLISPSLLIKYGIFSNGTKQVTNEISFYQNETSLHYASWLSTYLYIHKGYIWRGNDRLVFPRMKLLENQRIIMIESLKGSGFVRKWDVSKMKHKKSNRILDIDNILDQHYQMIKVPIYEANNNKDKTTAEQPQEQVISSQQSPPTHQYTKQLHKSVSLRYQYFHGDYCTHPINKFRRTNVILQCGESWMKIKQVSQASPCVYDMVVETRLLCRQGYEQVVDRVESLKKKDMESIVNLEKGVVCYPQSAWDNVLYTCDVENKDFNISFE